MTPADTRGSVALFDTNGHELWERHLRSLISHTATYGDIDGDGNIEIVVGTTSGHLFVLDGRSGDDHSPFPFRTRGRIMSPALITRLHDGPSQQLIFSSFDGYLYVVDGETGCADVVDIGETSYSMVLADDLNDDMKLDLVVSTMNGNVYMFETGADYHPMKTWTSQVCDAPEAFSQCLVGLDPFQVTSHAAQQPNAVRCSGGQLLLVGRQARFQSKSILCRAQMQFGGRS